MEVACTTLGLTWNEAPGQLFFGDTQINSIKAYEGHWKNLGAYLRLRGDYESLLLLHQNVPCNAPPIKTASVHEYIRYRTLKAGTPITDSSGPLLAADGHPVCHMNQTLNIYNSYCI